ncbi:MAG: phosphoribosylformylglycinamidine cyclo-ligase [Candidatus Omnitrophota bacterium]|jgi:phosphoribosylformylglycinamidine cyclo-ligase
MEKITYKASGVDIHAMDAFKGRIKPLLRKSFRPEVLKDIGSFGSFFRFPKAKYRDPVLVSSADGVGTKLKIAVLADKHDTVGIDAVAMNVNDILCTGAEPLFFLDYVAFSAVNDGVLADIVKGINDGCVQSGCSLIGGETAQMPGMYALGEYDIAGFCVGAVDRKAIIDGSQIVAGDAVIGLESSGLHSNGFSLVRKVLSVNELKRMSKELLRPTRIYVKPVLALLSAQPSKSGPAIKGISHITGGAFYDKIARILPDNVNVRINSGAWAIPEIFRLIQNKGSIDDKEMFHTLNMGIGLVLIVRPPAVKSIVAALAVSKIKSWVIGSVVKGKKQVEIV